MSPFDSLSEWHRLKTIRSLPRYNPIESHNPRPKGISPEAIIMAVVIGLWLMIFTGVLT